MSQDEADSLIERAAIFRHACDVDLLLFFAGHPRTLLASETLASYLGCELKQIADSLEVLLAAGLIKRTQSAAHAARLYLLMTDGSNPEWLRPLLQMGSTRQGRAMLKKALKQQPPEGNSGPVASTKSETIRKTDSASFSVRADTGDMIVRQSHRRGGRHG